MQLPDSSYLSKGQAGTHVFFSQALQLLSSLCVLEAYNVSVIGLQCVQRATALLFSITLHACIKDSMIGLKCMHAATLPSTCIECL